MEKGKKYKVWYQDDTTTRDKILIFLKGENGMVSFRNPKTDQEEEIPVTRIIRAVGINGLKENETKGKEEHNHNLHP